MKYQIHATTSDGILPRMYTTEYRCCLLEALYEFIRCGPILMWRSAYVFTLTETMAGHVVYFSGSLESLCTNAMIRIIKRAIDKEAVLEPVNWAQEGF